MFTLNFVVDIIKYISLLYMYEITGQTKSDSLLIMTVT